MPGLRHWLTVKYQLKNERNAMVVDLQTWRETRDQMEVIW